jgi:hypothetical protein
LEVIGGLWPVLDPSGPAGLGEQMPGTQAGEWRLSIGINSIRPRFGFVGRTDELGALMAWCEGDETDRLRLVTGPGGVGKTRLAVELAERMKKRGWASERIADGQEPVAVASLRAVTRARALLVVDYAETRRAKADDHRLGQRSGPPNSSPIWKRPRRY